MWIVQSCIGVIVVGPFGSMAVFALALQTLLENHVFPRQFEHGHWLVGVSSDAITEVVVGVVVVSGGGIDVICVVIVISFIVGKGSSKKSVSQTRAARDFLNCVQKPKIWFPIVPKEIDFFCQCCSDFFSKKRLKHDLENYDPYNYIKHVLNYWKCKEMLKHIIQY